MKRILLIFGIQNVPTNSADRPLEDIVVSMEVM